MMKSVVLFALVGLAFSAPQPRKVFHEHFQDFLNTLMDEAGDELQHIADHYFQYEEFHATMDYMLTNNFKELVYEMEDLPEFKAVVDFLENDNIDIHFFIDLLNDMLENFDRKRLSSRHETSGRDFSSFIADNIAAFPKEKLAALYEQKMAEDEEFRTAMDNLYSDEWEQTFGALWANPTFQAEVETLMANGIDIHLILQELKALFGQN